MSRGRLVVAAIAGLAVALVLVLVLGAVRCGAIRARRATAHRLAQLPTTRDGHPILASQNLGGGLSIAIVHDDTIDDPVTRWSECFRRILACHAPAEPSITSCVRRITPCARSEGGGSCCPPPCLRAFEQELAGGATEVAAVDRVFLDGACVPGFQVTDAP